MTATLSPDDPAESRPSGPPKVRTARRRRARSSTRRSSGRRRSTRSQAQPADDGAQPGDVHRRGRLGADHDPVPPRLRRQRRPGARVRGPRRAVAVVHRAVRQLRRGDGRGPRQGAGRRAAQDPRRHRRQGAAARRHDRGAPVVAAAGRRPLRRHRRRGHPRRRRDRRGHRHRRRVGDHRRVGAGHPRVGRRPLGRHRRHPRAAATRSSCASRPSRARRSSTA